MQCDHQRKLRAFTALATAILSVLAMPLCAADKEVWTFVDGTGVLHMGNAAPPAQRALIWLDKVPIATKASVQQQASYVQWSQQAAFEQVKAHLESAARAASLEPALVMAVAAAESAFNVDAISSKGALGLMQIMPATAARYGITDEAAASANEKKNGRHPVMEPSINARVGSRYLADLLRMFGGDTALALAAYNAGEGAVLRYGRRIPPWPETQNYVAKVMRLYQDAVAAADRP